MPKIARFSDLYDVFSAFLQRCLIEDRSLLWPEREVWTIAALEEARRRFVEGYVQGRLPLRAKLEAQLGGAPREVWALMADCFYIYGLPSRTIRYVTKRGWVEWAARQAGLLLPPEDDPLWQPLRQGFAPTGQKYNLKHAQLRLLVLLALEVKASASDPEARNRLLGDPAALQGMLDGMLESIPLRIDRAYDMRNAILYMAFPEQHEPLLSNRDKDAILRHYSRLLEEGGTDHDTLTSRDSALRALRPLLEPRLGQGFDFFDDAREEWRAPGWRMTSALLERTLAASTQNEAAQGAVRDQTSAGQAYRARSSTDGDLLRVLEALRLSRNVILSGPPGTGKTYIAQRAARALVEGQGESPEPFIRWVTLHPSYSYEDFVEGLRPLLAGRGRAAQGEGGVAYEVRPGVFREMCERAFRDPEHTYVLVLDEINRAHLARILGELVTLLEDDKRGVLSARLPYSGQQLSVPPNLILLGTMNTADRSIALLDAALRRRFAFVEMHPRPELLAGAEVETEEAVLHLDALLRCLNAAILETLDPGHQLGHSYFLRVARAPAEERLSTLELVWNTQVLPLLEEMFYNRRDRLTEILAPFIDDGDPLAPREIARLSGEDLLVALSRLCER